MGEPVLTTRMTDREGAPNGSTRTGYDVLAERTGGGADDWESPWGENPLQRYYSWPATREMTPDLAGKRVLLAGCGVGDHTGEILDGGASVVGIDASGRAIEVARERFGDRATFRRADLTDPLDSGDDSFDLVLSHLVLDHVVEWAPTLAEFRRVLASGGALVFTTIHPMQYYLEHDAVADYYGRHAVELGWDAPVRSYHRPLAEVVNSLATAGFRVESMAEPRPPEAYVERAHERWEVEERPQILCVRARAPETGQ